MTRIFPSLASLSLMLYALALGLGLSIGDLYDHPTQAVVDQKGTHLLAGVAAALAVVFVESIVVTYFVGTSRWCKEVTETYQLDPSDLIASTRLKRRTFPLAVIGMLSVVAIGALGAASDPGTGRENTAMMAQVHLPAALAGICLVGWTYYRSWLNIAENQSVIARIVAQVRAIRIAKGLDVEPLAGTDASADDDSAAEAHAAAK
ncbi:MAG: hypothetical protein KDA44_16950 [Planctomycetales bacterium]|nr:hypothetical protein [Planctomycetales bacterium]